jgi:hypothetical protein
MCIKLVLEVRQLVDIFSSAFCAHSPSFCVPPSYLLRLNYFYLSFSHALESLRH